MTSPVTIRGVRHAFGALHVLHGLDLAIAAGEYVVLLGPSGCGKTTLLSVLGGFVTPDAGRVRIAERDVTALPPARRPTTTVFQDYALFPHMTLAENVAFGLRMAGRPKAERLATAARVLALVGLDGAGARRPHEISGGQRQRVALARALAVGPEVLLLDEPLGALDLRLRRAMQDELKSIQRGVGTTFVHVTHDQEEAMALADRVVVMNAGRIEDDGPPDRVYRAPRTLFAAGFMGEMNRIPATSGPAGVSTAFGLAPVAAPVSAALTGPAVLCLRPEALGRGGGWALGGARVTGAAFLGQHWRVHATPDAAPDLPLAVHLPPGAPPPDRIDLSADPADLLVYPA